MVTVKQEIPTLFTVMSTIRRFLLSRSTILALIVLLLGAVVAAAVFPQRFTASPQEMARWQEKYATVAPWFERFGLDHVYTSAWFMGLLCLFLLSLLISLHTQMQVAWRRTFGPGLEPAGQWVPVAVSEHSLHDAMGKAGFLRTSRSGAMTKFTKNPWGHWGNSFMHLGFVMIICSSLVLAATQKMGLLHLYEGELHRPGDPWILEENGFLATKFLLPVAIRLDKVQPEYWDNDALRQLSSRISVVPFDGRARQYALAVNQPLNLKKMRVYLGREYGNAFFLDIEDSGGRTFPSIVQISHPAEKDEPSYDNFHIEGIPFRFKAKYFADAQKLTLNSSNPLLTLRLVDQDRVLGETALTIGQSGTLGPFTVTLRAVRHWSSLIFSEEHGMAGVFSGFFLVIVGSGLFYFFPVREIYAKREGNGLLIAWRALRFSKLFAGEFDHILQTLGKEGRT